MLRFFISNLWDVLSFFNAHWLSLIVDYLFKWYVVVFRRACFSFFLSFFLFFTIFGYTLFLYELTFCYISFHSFFLRNWKQREIEGNLKIISNQYLSLAVSHYAALSSHYFYIFFANSHFWPISSINSFSPITNLRQIKFTIMWQYKF